MDSFGSKGTLNVGDEAYEIFRIAAVPGSERLPFTHKVLLENLLRTEDGANVTKETIAALGSWDASAEPSEEIQFTPARVIMQDFTGVPCVVDLATMREAMAELGGDAAKINPLAPAEMVIDHSVMADVFGTPEAFEKNVEIEYERNRERYQFLRWGQGAFDDFKVVPPGTGIVHQVNIEHLARTIFTRTVDGVLQAYPDTCVGTDSHTTMVNGIGVVGWGVGGIEAEAAMLGQPVSMLIPRVVGFKLNGTLPEGDNLEPLFKTILETIPAPTYDEGAPLQAHVTNLDASPFLGRLALLRIKQGMLKKGQQVAWMQRDGGVKNVKITELLITEGLERKPGESAGPGDIVAVAGIPDITIGETLADPENPVALPVITVDEPSISMTIGINTSPLAGRSGGTKLTANQVKARLESELIGNVSIRMRETERPDAWEVQGRGELQIGRASCKERV